MFATLAFAVSVLVLACGDDSDPEGNPDASSTDAGNPLDAGDNGGEGPRDVVLNVGAACRGANGCMGSGPTCQTALSLFGQEIPFAGGYCTATCKNHIECGEAGECPVGESLKALTSIPLITPEIRILIETAAPSQCYERCTGDGECRTGENYRCASILSALTQGAGQAGLNVGGFDVSAFLSGPIRDSKYCLPPAPDFSDAGLPDAAPSDAASGDAAPSDAASGDAAPSDAASGDEAASDGSAAHSGPGDGSQPV